MMKRVALFLPLAVFIGFVAVAIWRLGEPGNPAIRSQLVGKPVPVFALAGLGPERPGLGSADLAGGGPRLVNLFASWCIPCRVEAPVLAELRRRGVVIDGIAVRDTPETIRAFLAEHGDPYRRIGIDSESRAMLALGASGVPETFLVDGKGIIRVQYIGELRHEQIDTVLAAIRDAS
jgi:cytochrome c biogenesis protein CcmG/thiol:disulfide interchange protein DsbE